MDALPVPMAGAPAKLPLRLLVVSEAAFIGEALAKALAQISTATTDACDNSSATLWDRAAVQADAVLVDAGDREGTETVKRLREAAPHLPIIACAVKETDDEVLRWAEAGVTGYLPSTIKLADIVPRVSDILDGEQICSTRVAAALFRRVSAVAGTHTVDRTEPLARTLTRREREIAGLVAAGLGDKQIARELHISLATTKTHVHNLLGKLNVAQRRAVADALVGRGVPTANTKNVVRRTEQIAAF